MARPVRDIPGFYWDKEKGKYFAIQAQGPAGSAYSAQDVKRRKLRDDQEVAVENEKRRQAGRIRRRIHEDPLVGGALSREYGYGACFEPARIYAAGLVPSGYVPEEDLTVRLRAQIQTPRNSRVSPVFNISHLAGGASSKLDIRRVYDTHHTVSRVDLDTAPTGNQYFKTPRRDWGPQIQPVGDPTSICESADRQMFAFTLLSGTAHDAIVIRPTAPEYEDISSQGIRHILMGPGHSRGDVSMFCSAPGPFSSSLAFVFGSSRGIMATEKRDLETTWRTPRPQSDPSVVDDLFALAFLTDNPSILFSGGRQGILALADLRIPIKTFRSDTITHPSTITHIRSLNAHQIIVAGLNSTLCQYDLRYRKSYLTSSHSLNKPKSRNNPIPTQPSLTYPSYHNTATWQIGFDVDLHSGIVAAAQESDDFHPPVQLFSLSGGHALKSPVMGTGTGLENAAGMERETVKCLRWSRGEETGKGSLWVGVRAGIQRYA